MRETRSKEKQRRTKEENKRRNTREMEETIPEQKETKEKEIKCFYANARSIINRRKRMELELYVEEEEPDIIGLTETWAKEEMGDCELEIEGYVMFRRDRGKQKTKGHGAGGVLLYVKNDIVAVERQDLSKDERTENVWCEIQIGRKKLLIGVCYRPPVYEEGAEKGLYEVIEKASKDSTVIMGDFNYHVNWEEEEGERPQDRNCLDLVSDTFLQQHVTEITRDGSKYISDLVLTSEENMVDNIEVGENFNNSDHKIIRWTMTVGNQKEKEEKRTRYKFFGADYDVVRNKLREKEIEEKAEGLGVNETWEMLVKSLREVMEETLPKVKTMVKRRPWVTREVQKRRRMKQKAWKKYNRIKESKDSEDQSMKRRMDKLKELYVRKRNESNKANKKAVHDYERKLAENVKNDSKSFYKYVRSRQKKRDRVGPITNDKGSVIMEDEKTAEELNKYFGSVFNKEDAVNIPEAMKMFNAEEEQRLKTVTFTREKVTEQLEKLKTDKSPGTDEIHPKFLKEVKEEVGGILAHIMEQSMKTGEIPQDWRDALIVPIFKKGSRSEAKNYRPVSLTSIVCKVMEKIIKEEMIEHYERYNVINNSQHGFTKGRSCLTNLLDFFDEMYKKMDEGKPVDIIYLDFAKAFDKVPHKRLGKKLEASGIGGNLLKWLEQWLSNRRQKVGIRGKYSKWSRVWSGVPQGSVLGPLLFVVFINDIDSGIVSKISKFADDTKMGCGVDTEEEADVLRRDIGRLQRWAGEWQMMFNTEKCSVMHMGKNNKEFQYEMGGILLRNSEEERDLGVIVNSSTKPARQCAEAAKKANKVLGMIKRTIISREKGIMLELYKSLVRPNLEYCVQVWSPYLRQDVERLEKIQRRATKMIRGLGNLTYEERLWRCELTTLEQRRNRGDLIEAFKIVTGRDKIPAQRLFEFAVDKRTRGHSYKMIKKSSGTIMQRFFSARVVNNWNKLGEEIVTADSVKKFKKGLGELGY